MAHLCGGSQAHSSWVTPSKIKGNTHGLPLSGPDSVSQMPAPEADPESGNGQLALQTPHFPGCMPSFVSTLRVFCFKAGMFQSPGFKIFIYLSSTPYPRVNKCRIFRTFIVGNTIVDEGEDAGFAGVCACCCFTKTRARSRG